MVQKQEFNSHTLTQPAPQPGPTTCALPRRLPSCTPNPTRRHCSLASGDVLQRHSRRILRVLAAVARERREHLPAAGARDGRLAGGAVLSEVAQRECRLTLRLRAAFLHESHERLDAALAPDFLLDGVVAESEVGQPVCRPRPLPLAPGPQQRNPPRDARVGRCAPTTMVDESARSAQAQKARLGRALVNVSVGCR